MKVAFVMLGVLSLSACGTDRPTATVDSLTSCVTAGGGVQPSSATLHPGDTLRLRVAPWVCNGVVYAAVYEWSSNNTAVAVVDPATALVTARAAGQATIIATAVNDPNDKSAMVLFVAP